MDRVLAVLCLFAGCAFGHPHTSEWNEDNTDACLWSSWEAWGHCDSGYPQRSMSRFRKCEAVFLTCSETDCPGTNEDTQECVPVWSQWKRWSKCSVTCEIGREVRKRRCKIPKGIKGKCKGRKREKRICRKGCCPESAIPILTAWGSWGRCSAGSRTRFRTCDVIKKCRPNPCLKYPRYEAEDCKRRKPPG